MVAEARVVLTSVTSADLASVPDEAVERLRGARRVLAIGHESPDADAFGSALGIALAVEWLGGRATPMSSDPVPEMYRFMPCIERIAAEPDPDVDYDLIVVTDSGELSRVGRVAREHAELFGRVPILVVDHHASNVGFGAVDYVDPRAAAACEQVALLLARLGVPLDAHGGAIAGDLMAGIIGDTASFQHPNVTPRTLRVSAELLEAGAPMSDVTRRLYRSKPNEQIRLFGVVLARVESAKDGRLVWATLLPSDLASAGAVAEQSEGIIDLLAQSATAEVAILFRDQGDSTRISTRTRDGGVDAITLTSAFGGGGHPRAAGATVQLPIDQAKEAVLAHAAGLVDAIGR
ncbi:MAG: bifunctional oligoribonuclease/PAP phosphatase NrnA [Candidatus Limnocylindrales bacterium]